MDTAAAGAQKIRTTVVADRVSVDGVAEPTVIAERTDSAGTGVVPEATIVTPIRRADCHIAAVAPVAVAPVAGALVAAELAIGTGKLDCCSMAPLRVPATEGPKVGPSTAAQKVVPGRPGSAAA